MSRPIKFRAWDPMGKEFLVGFYVQAETGKAFSEDGEFMPFEEDGVIIEEFTGLHDKNGREIYEGDIVELGLGEVVWCDDEAGFHLRWHDAKFKTARASITQRYESTEPIFANAKFSLKVIGNIHENPELVK